MSNFEEVDQETEKLFKDYVYQSNIPTFVRIKILSNSKIKADFGIVSKANDIVKYMTDYDVIIQINEFIFSQLEEKHQDYIIKDLLAQISYDMEKDKLSIDKPDVKTFSGVLQQHDIDTYLGAKTTISALADVQRMQEDMAKQAEKASRKATA
jgi:hypothetical protein